MKNLKILLLVMVTMFLVVGCQKDDANLKTKEKTSKSEENNEQMSLGTIHVVSREVGSGTRGAFSEITKTISKDKDGNEVDNTYAEATIVNSTEGVITTVSGDENGIGYISLASLKDDVKALKIDGVDANAQNIKEGTYKIARPFIITYHEDKSNDLAQDFIKFILSKDGQKIVESDGCVSIDSDYDYQPKNIDGTLTIAGSTSVTPLMEKLVDKYKQMNPGFKADIESNGSSAGIKAAIEGIADIGMSSRELKDEEKEQVDNVVIARDGIALIVNHENTTESISVDRVHDIFTGAITEWKEVE